MNYQITHIELDFDDEDEDEDELTVVCKEVITSSCTEQIWVADDEDDLIEKITNATGWCIKTINYKHILS
jgi:hypothetical protein